MGEKENELGAGKKKKKNDAKKRSPSLPFFPRHYVLLPCSLARSASSSAPRGNRHEKKKKRRGRKGKRKGGGMVGRPPLGAAGTKTAVPPSNRPTPTSTLLIARKEGEKRAGNGGNRGMLSASRGKEEKEEKGEERRKGSPMSRSVGPSDRPADPPVPRVHHSRNKREERTPLGPAISQKKPEGRRSSSDGRRNIFVSVFFSSKKTFQFRFLEKELLLAPLPFSPPAAIRYGFLLMEHHPLIPALFRLPPFCGSLFTMAGEKRENAFLFLLQVPFLRYLTGLQLRNRAKCRSVVGSCWPRPDRSHSR